MSDPLFDRTLIVMAEASVWALVSQVSVGAAEAACHLRVFSYG